MGGGPHGWSGNVCFGLILLQHGSFTQLRPATLTGGIPRPDRVWALLPGCAQGAQYHPHGMLFCTKPCPTLWVEGGGLSSATGLWGRGAPGHLSGPGIPHLTQGGKVASAGHHPLCLQPGRACARPPVCSGSSAITGSTSRMSREAQQGRRTALRCTWPGCRGPILWVLPQDPRAPPLHARPRGLHQGQELV